MRKLTNDELLKLKAVVLYIVNKCEAIDYFHLFKILYFADKAHYAKYGRRIIHDTYCAFKNGPVPSKLYDALKIVTHRATGCNNSSLKIIIDALYQADSDYDYVISAKEKPDMDELSRTDVECLNKSINENRSLSFPELSNKSHDEAWQKAWNKRQNSPLDEITIAKAGGADSSMLEYIKESDLIDALIG